MKTQILKNIQIFCAHKPYHICGTFDSDFNLALCGDFYSIAKLNVHQHYCYNMTISQVIYINNVLLPNKMSTNLHLCTNSPYLMFVKYTMYFSCWIILTH